MLPPCQQTRKRPLSGSGQTEQALRMHLDFMGLDDANPLAAPRVTPGEQLAEILVPRSTFNQKQNSPRSESNVRAHERSKTYFASGLPKAWRSVKTIEVGQG